MDKPLISVIVPIYKVEEYLPSCLDSICSQTYKNLEIVLVDDGSPDKCGDICDRYAESDPRIKVIHRANGGLSAARNTGIAVATGEYIGFVDSDDRIEPDMYQKLIAAAVSEDADLAACGRMDAYADVSVPIRIEAGIYKDRDILKAMLDDKLGEGTVWNKIYRREYVVSALFPEGYDFEDVLTLYRFVARMNKAVVITDPLYIHLIRNSSICHDHTVKNLIDYWHAFHTRYTDVMSYPEYSGDREVEALLLKGCASAVSRTWRWAYGLRKVDKPAVDELTSEVSSFVKTHYGTFGVKGYPKVYNLMLFLARSDNGVSKFFAYHINQLGRKIKGVDDRLN
ncbi:glycosyltransferase [Butyrivibrio sp. AE2032]|uniref:glycosyltransferase n=1 Tax=Butyrivibrio sp. AE2032 TaxID=1458463 RepID=UPI0006899B02|nr:glycosyltransferase [Butyrivibrio sp. AE2032]